MSRSNFRRLFIDYQFSGPACKRREEWITSEFTTDKRASVCFTLEGAIRMANYYRRLCPHDRVFYYGIPYLPSTDIYRGRHGRFWALVVTTNMSIFEVNEGHIRDSRHLAVVLSYEQLTTLIDHGVQNYELRKET